MKTVRRMAAVAALAMFATTQAFAQAAPVPSDLKLVKPAEDVPAACAQFFQPEGWGAGAWGKNYIANRIWVEKVNPDCTAQMVYSWGTSTDGKTVEGYVRGTAVIAEGKMSMIINSSGTVQVVYTYVDEPRSLRGMWTRTTPSGQTRAFAVIVPMPSKVASN